MLRILKTYLSQIKEIKESDKEHTHRTPLENFLKDTLSLLGLKQNIQIIHEPNHDKEGRGAPDFLIVKDGLALGYIETKRINADLNEIKNSQQIEKYLKLSPNLILTDYLRFCLIGINEGQVNILKEFRICEYSELKNLSNNQIQTKTTRVQEFFELFFSKIPSLLVMPKALRMH